MVYGVIQETTNDRGEISVEKYVTVAFDYSHIKGNTTCEVLLLTNAARLAVAVSVDMEGDEQNPVVDQWMEFYGFSDPVYA